MTIAFIGDIILNNRYKQLWKENINPFLEISNFLKEFDFVIGNLESLSKGKEGRNPLRSTILETDIETLGFLKTLHIDAVTLAHNHVYDYKESGFELTTKRLDELGIEWLGATTKKDKIRKPLILEKNGIKVGLLNYVSDDTNPNIPEDAGVYVNWLNSMNVVADVHHLKKSVDHVVLLPHWGGLTEYSLLPHYTQVNLANKFIDAGADLVIGNHSHTVQPLQRLGTKSVYYSLGNFCYDGKIIYGYRARRVRIGAIAVCNAGVKEIKVERKLIFNENLNICMTDESIVNIRKPQKVIDSKLINRQKFYNWAHINFERYLNRITNFIGRFTPLLKKY